MSVTARTAQRARVAVIAEWALVAVAALGALVLPFLGANPLSALFGAALVLAFVHGIRRYGAGRLVAFFLIAWLISNFWENLSIVTGFPFGEYHYTQHPQLIFVPIQIGIVYFGLGYVSWMTANAVLGTADQHLDVRTRAGRVNVIALPVLAGSVMTMFDVGADSTSATVQGNWIWEGGGGLFGVPWTNYLGWWFVTWSFFQIFTVVLARAQSRDSSRPVRPTSVTAPVLVYLAIAVSSITIHLASGGPETVSDATGAVWNTADILESMMVINVFSSGAIALFALTRIARRDI